ncbi:MAG: hypothetical protein FKY71_08610 [Spiribacter salinus]|uniref:7-cyano-7-deazaguanine synthase n=1 Tax=Spiribacter salinus TaxID=1335746 RepID=A0A540VRQ3_9GAMM|nr:MAG: hypothetical protein FKY71_08610 [Spiribacter salinus]
MTKVILNSGGMDSFFVARMVPDAHHVFVDVGQRYAHKEREAARRIADHVGQPLEIVLSADIAKFEHKPSGIIPLRNAELILQAAQYGNDIYLGILSNEINSDKSPEFLRAMEEVLNISCRAQYWSAGTHFTLHTPLGTQSKAQLVAGLLAAVRRDITYHAAWQTMLSTVSCYDGGGLHCGKCPSCFKRWVALTVATGVDADSLHPFVEDPATWATLEEWEAKGYPEERIQEIRDAYAIAGL